MQQVARLEASARFDDDIFGREVYGRHAIRDDIFHGFAVYDLVIDEDVQVGDIVVSAQLDIYFPEGLSHIRGQIAAVPARRPDLSRDEKYALQVLSRMPFELRPAGLLDCLQSDFAGIVTLHYFYVSGVYQVAFLVRFDPVFACGYLCKQAYPAQSRVSGYFLSGGYQAPGDHDRLTLDLVDGREADVGVGLQFPCAVFYCHAERCRVGFLHRESDVAVGLLPDVVDFDPDRKPGPGLEFRMSL